MTIVLRTLIGLSVLLSLIGCGGNPASSINKNAPQGTGMKLLEAQTSSGKSKYSIFVPYNYDPKFKYPTIVFLHGLFEGGSDGKKNTTVGIGPHVSKKAKQFGYIVIFAQTGGSWSNDDEYVRVVNILDDASRRYNIDQDRVVLTGLSTGARGTWGTAALYPDRFCALIPIGGYEVKDAIPKVKHIPAWAFHNRGDPFVLASSSSNMIKWLNAAGGQGKLTLYGALGHNAWDRAYNDPELWSWIASKRRK
jgi:predicted peptidase